MVPNELDPKAVLGALNRGVLVKLKNSARNSSFIFSRIWTFLKNDAFRLRIPSPRVPPSYRGAVPGTCGAGAEKADVLK
jgi:hypothetical protein